MGTLQALWLVVFSSVNKHKVDIFDIKLHLRIFVMHIEPVEIYSDASNAAVMRHLGRRFPGCLIQGDSLNILVSALTVVQSEASCLSEEAADELAGVTEKLTQLLEHYKATLLSHGLELLF